MPADDHPVLHGPLARAMTGSAPRTRRRPGAPRLLPLALPVALALAAVLTAGLATGSTASPAGTADAAASAARGHGAGGAGATSASGGSSPAGPAAVTAAWRYRHPPATTTTTSTTTATTVPTTTIPTTTTTTTAPASGACGGEVVAKATGGSWQCTFDDEFNGTSLDTTKWVVQQTANSGFRNGPECYVNSPNNESVGNGVLSLTARTEASQFTCADPFGSYASQWTSGTVSTYGLFDQTYGRFEVRAKLPAPTAPGLQETLWLWPQTQTYGAWPASGEIDFAEFYSQYPTYDIPYIHYNAAGNDPNVTSYNCSVGDVSQFHTYAVEWTPSSITTLYDGKTCMVDNWDPVLPLVHPQPFDQPFFICLTQALGTYTNAFNPSSTPMPATTQIDYVRAWK